MNKDTRIVLVLILIIILSMSGCFSSTSIETSNYFDEKINSTNNYISIDPNTINNDDSNKLNQSQQIEMIFLGDVMMDSFIADYINDYGFDYPWTDVSELINAADIAVANLETSVSEIGSTKKPTGYGFRSAPETLEGLKNSGIDLVSLANNHVMDFGTDAFYDTLRYLNDYNIKSVGGGANISEAEKLIVIEHNNIKTGFLSFSSIIPWDEWRATKDNPGIAAFTPNNYDNVLNAISLAEDSVDILIVLLHWGTEHKDTPDNWQIDMSHKLIDNGADLIVGHHPHVLQGIELYKNKPILYSIGNFVFLKKDDEAGKTGVFKLTFDKNGFIEGNIFPVNIKYTKANLLKENDAMKQEIIDKLAFLSKAFGTYIDTTGSF